MMTTTPPKAEVERVAAQLGCTRLQALRHLQGRQAAIDALARRRRAAMRGGSEGGAQA